MMASVRTVMLVLALGASCAHAADIGYLAPRGVPAEKFPPPKRPVAQIVERVRPGYYAEHHLVNPLGEKVAKR